MHYFRKLGIAVFLSGALVTMANAQVMSSLLKPTNVPGVKVVAPPPVGFDPVTASPAARKQFAIPPAPNEAVAPRAYNEWKKAVSGIRNRDAAPVLTQTRIANGPIKNKKLGGSPPPGYSVGSNMSNVANLITVTSNNWSGPSFVDPTNPFALEAIVGEFVVPTAHVAFGSCTPAVYSSQWPGIDGNNSNDVLQAGVEADATCSGGVTTTSYTAWIEWFPNFETAVSSPVIHPGDLVYVAVWNISPTSGYAYFYNFSTQISAQYTLTAPGGTQLVGNSVEWIVERPGVGGGLATLTNYIDVSWPYNFAWNYDAPRPTYYYPYVAPPTNTGTLELIQMLDDSNKGISFGYYQNSDFYFFVDYGSANGGSTAPFY